MKLGSLLTGLLLALGFLAGAAEAQNQIGSRGAVTVGPQKSYIFFRAREKVELIFLRTVTPEQVTAWRADRARALVRAQEAYVRAQRDYDRTMGSCRSNPQACMNLPRPTPVTDETFYFPPSEMGNFIPVSKGPQFSQQEDGYTYLLEVPPGEYTLYASTASGSYGIAGFCLCMGSLRFDAPAGRIVDLGELRYAADEARQAQHVPTIGRIRSLEIVPWQASMARPERLAGLPVQPAALLAADKMPNYLGIFIDRHPAIPGLLRYERDRVIDDRPGQAAAP